MSNRYNYLYPEFIPTPDAAQSFDLLVYCRTCARITLWDWRENESDGEIIIEECRECGERTFYNGS